MFCVWETRLSAQQVDPENAARANALNREIAEAEFKLQSMAVEKVASEKSIEEARQRADVLSSKRESLLRKQDESGVSSVSFDEIIRQLQTQRVQLSVDLAGIEARREILVEARESMQNDTAAESSAVVKAIEDLLAIQKERLNLAEALSAKGSASNMEVLAAKQQLLETQIRLAEQAHAARAKSGPPMDAELLTVSLARAETAARLNRVNQLLGEYVAARTTIEALNQVHSEIALVQAMLAELGQKSKSRDESQRQIRFRKDQLTEELKSLQSGSEKNDR
jgi:hypothetical protein